MDALITRTADRGSGGDDAAVVGAILGVAAAGGPATAALAGDGAGEMRTDRQSPPIIAANALTAEAAGTAGAPAFPATATVGVAVRSGAADMASPGASKPRTAPSQDPGQDQSGDPAQAGADGGDSCRGGAVTGRQFLPGRTGESGRRRRRRAGTKHAARPDDFHRRRRSRCRYSER
jgi:hypothetical protein